MNKNLSGGWRDGLLLQGLTYSAPLKAQHPTSLRQPSVRTTA